MSEAPVEVVLMESQVRYYRSFVLRLGSEHRFVVVAYHH